MYCKLAEYKKGYQINYSQIESIQIRTIKSDSYPEGSNKHFPGQTQIKMGSKNVSDFPNEHPIVCQIQWTPKKKLWSIKIIKNKNNKGLRSEAQCNNCVAVYTISRHFKLLHMFIAQELVFLVNPLLHIPHQELLLRSQHHNIVCKVKDDRQRSQLEANSSSIFHISRHLHVIHRSTLCSPLE